MPTNNPRVTVMLKPDDYAVLATLSELQGVSKSSLLADIWAQACPVMIRVAKLLQEAKSAQESVKEGIREASEAAMLQIEPIANQVMLNFDLFEESILDQIAEGHKARFAPGGVPALPGGPGREAPKPPPSNTGVRFSKQAKKSQSGRGG
jgi:hypothetical protein